MCLPREWSSNLGLSEDSSSSLYVKWWHTVLREAGYGHALGVAGQRKNFLVLKQGIIVVLSVEE